MKDPHLYWRGEIKGKQKETEPKRAPIYLNSAEDHDF